MKWKFLLCSTVVPLLFGQEPGFTEKISPLVKFSRRAPTVGWYVVEFHPDVSTNDARRIAVTTGIPVRENPDLRTQHLLIQATEQQLIELSNWDEVAYLFPASRELVRGEFVHGCAGGLTASGAMGQYVASIGDGWDGPGLGSAALSYAFGSVSNKIDVYTMRAEIQRAMSEWSRVVKVSFAESGNTASAKHAQIFFATGAHGDAYPFDGPGKVLAHTFYPAPPNSEPVAGDLHLDADEAWRVGSDLDLYSVVLHELGHALGLGHSDQPGAVMYPYYRLATALTQEDITAIQRLYAAPGSTSNPPPPNPPPPPTPSPNPNDTTPPTMKVVSPASTNILTSAATISLRGTASDTSGIKQVYWTTTSGGTGIASGTTDWSIPGIPLYTGTNYITVRAIDNAGNTSWRSLVVTRR